MSSNVAQNYPYTTETEDERAAAIAGALERFDGLAERIASEASPLPALPPAEPGKPHRWWVFVCPRDVDGRLHVAGHASERHALYTICDIGGESYLR
ncbi:MAG: hypothetical protein M3N29_00395 [Chloroflexota bacterium]|nr:hypothetical protein [Chloroflexota bacterium]